MVEDRSLLSPDLIADPHPYFRRLREEDPVHWSDHHRAWMLTRYADVVRAFRDPRLSSERVTSLLPQELGAGDAGAFDPILRLLANWMVFRDPPAHARLRRLARAAFAPRVIEALRPMIGSVFEDLAAKLERAGGGDLVRDLAYPLPAIVIARLLGVPEGDLEAFKGWSADIQPIVFGAAGTAERRRRAERGLLALEGYFRGLLDGYRRDPADNLLSALSRAEEEGEVLTSDEIIATAILLLFAGHETTTSLIAAGTLTLERHPEEKRRLAASPELAATAVEEFLRFEGPSKVQVRLAVEDLEIRGRRVRSGQRVFLVQAAAHRDPDEFADPDRVDVAREPNEHLGFGYGIHHCLGAPLARLEGRIVFGSLPGRLPGLRLAGEPHWSAAVVGRGLTRLPVST